MPKTRPVLVLLAAATAALPLSPPVHAERHAALELHTLVEAVPAAAGDTLRVMTLNLAHGRADGVHQVFQSAASREASLDSIAALLAREAPDVVAVQEADGPSSWSGGFCHVRELAEDAGYGWAVHSHHMNTARLHYGTGLLSRGPVRESAALTFAPTPPTTLKGLTRTTVALGGREVDVVSVHLDFASREARLGQVDQMVAALETHDHPLVVMGDFNAGWADRDSAVQALAGRLGLQAWQPELPAEAAATFPRSQRRLDWILTSEELVFDGYTVLDDVVSDHRAVVADLRWRDAGVPGPTVAHRP